MYLHSADPNGAYPDDTYPNGACPDDAYPNGAYLNDAYPDGVWSPYYSRVDVTVEKKEVVGKNGDVADGVAKKAKHFDDLDALMDAPTAQVYESRNGDIVDTSHGFLKKAEGQLDAATKVEIETSPRMTAQVWICELCHESQHLLASVHKLIIDEQTMEDVDFCGNRCDCEFWGPPCNPCGTKVKTETSP